VQPGAGHLSHKTKGQNLMKKTWLELAINPKKHPYDVTHGNIGTDGIRLHYDPTAPAPKDDDSLYTVATEQILPAARKQQAMEFTITKAALETACKQALAIGKDVRRPQYDRTPALKIGVNGSMTYRATDEENGSVSGEWNTMTFETSRKTSFPVVSSYKLGKGMSTFYTVKVEYSHTGRDVEFAINPRFLLDTLSGFESDTVTIRTNAKNAPVYLTDGTREAVIMQICM
jgi:hypothetical protein